MNATRALDWPGNYVPASPISAGWRVGNLLILSGQVPRDSETGVVAERNIVAQTDSVIDNLTLLLSQNRLSLADVVRCTIYLTAAENFDAFNRVYGNRFRAPYPARTTLIVGLANPNYLIELDAVVALTAV